MSASLILGLLRQKGASLWLLLIGHWAFDVLGVGLPALMTLLA